MAKKKQKGKGNKQKGYWKKLGRKVAKKKNLLSRSKEKNRYQKLLSRISSYYKGIGKPLKRPDLYKEYRRIRDDFSWLDINTLTGKTNFKKYVIQKTKSRPPLPVYLLTPSPWYDFEFLMTKQQTQDYFRSKDQIILDLSQINMSNVQFPYYDTQNKLSIIGIYRKLYGNPTFRTIMKAQSPPLCFEYDDINSDPANGIYIFVLIDCEPEEEKEEKKETKKSDDEFIKGEIAALRKEKLADKDLYKKGKISKKEYNKREKKIEREISEYKDQLKNT